MIIHLIETVRIIIIASINFENPTIFFVSSTSRKAFYSVGVRFVSVSTAVISAFCSTPEKRQKVGERNGTERERGGGRWGRKRRIDRENERKEKWRASFVSCYCHPFTYAQETFSKTNFRIQHKFQIYFPAAFPISNACPTSYLNQTL